MNKEIIPLNRGMNKSGGAYFCQNIAPARDDGVSAGLSLYAHSNKSTVATSVNYYMSPIYEFAQDGTYDTFNAMSIWGRDYYGDIHLMNYIGTYICKAADYGQTNDVARGMCVDPNGDLIYAGSRYIGKAFETTLSATCAVAATTCSLTSTASFGASGYVLFRDATIANSEVVQYTGKSASGLTGLTRARYNTTDRQHLSTTKVYYFDDDWKDLGADNATSYRSMKNWENKTLIANGRYVATLTGDTLDADALILPEGYDVRDFGFLPTGSTSKILVCANKDEEGSIFVWDGKDNTWITQIKMENISCADGYYIATDLGVYECNGATVNCVWRSPDSDNTISGRRFQISYIKERGDYVLIVGAYNAYLRGASGLYIYSKNTGDTFFVADNGLGKYDTNMFSILSSSERVVLVGSDYCGGSIQRLQNYPLANGSQYWYLFKPANAQTIKLKKVKLNIGSDLGYYTNPHDDFYFDVVVRYSDFTRPFYRYSQLKAGASETTGSSLVLNSGTLSIPEVGDRVEIIARNYSTDSANAGCPRNITAVVSATDSYVVSLDEDLPYSTTATQYNDSSMCSLVALKKAGKISVNGDIFLKDLSFNIPDQPEGKKFMFEIEVRVHDTNITYCPELNYMEVYYDIVE